MVDLDELDQLLLDPACFDDAGALCLCLVLAPLDDVPEIVSCFLKHGVELRVDGGVALPARTSKALELLDELIQHSRLVIRAH